MRFNSNALGLPASILLLVISQTLATKSGHNERSLAPRPQEIEDTESLNTVRSPIGVMKMSSDEGEKFYPEYWQYEQVLGRTSKLGLPLRRDEDAGLLANVSMNFDAPLALHTNSESSYEDLKARKLLEGRNAAAALAILEKRDFVCPAGYASCSAIGYPNSCCSTGQTCYTIQDTGLGPVGCCQNGYTCGGSITTCGANTACASSLGGGCCIPNFTCAGVGCVINSTVVTTTITRIFTVSIFPSSTHLTTIVTVSTSTSSPSSSSIPTSTVLQPTSTTITKTSTSTPPTGSSSGTGVIVVRPTSITSSSTGTTATETSCPVGFYGCSAFYRGGCCRTGRDCNTTSCPPVESTTIISSGVTIVVPVGLAATVATPTGACATGWSSCAASVGGNCCLSGWECGTASCSSVGASSTAVEQKASPNAGSSEVWRRGVVVLSGVVGAFFLGMILL